MSDDLDLLTRATRALREETRGDDTGARFTRSRIMASVHDERVRKRTRLAFLLPVAATFVAASAWGAANGKLEQAVSAISEAIGFAPPAPPPPAPSVRPRAARAAAPPKVEAVPALPAPPLPEPEPAPAEPVAVNEPPRAAAPRPSGLEQTSPDPAFELYRAAHRAHFVERDSARALAAWDAYLKAAPKAALSLEARYNRAICLVRLKRDTEARAALRPFAEGRYGGYRKAEAAELLQALPPELAGPEPGL